jgi:hypothetical protein
VGQLAGDRPHAAGGTGDGDRIPLARRHGVHRGVGGGPGDEEGAGDLPRHAGGARGEVAGVDRHQLGLAGPVVGEPDHLVPDGHIRDGRADLVDDPGEVAALARRERGRPALV